MQGHTALESFLSSFTRCSRRVLRVYGILDDKGHGGMLLLGLRRLGHYLFAYLE